MYKQEQINPYGAKGEKGKLVEAMFNDIAPTYDELNHKMSFNIDKWWRHKAISQLKKYSIANLLDIATGTGDFAMQAAGELPLKTITGIDISQKMLDIAKKKTVVLTQSKQFKFMKADCEHMPFNDNSYDAITSAFGIRNFQNLDNCLVEMHRVLKPNGVLCILELSEPNRFPMKQLFYLYSHSILPLYGRIIAHNSDAYKYLTSTIEAFPQAENMQKVLLKAGFSKVSFRRLTFGICTLFLAIK